MGKESNYFVIQQSIEENLFNKFNDLYDKLRKYAVKKKIKKPMKGDFLAKVMKHGIDMFDNPENYFKEIKSTKDKNIITHECSI